MRALFVRDLTKQNHVLNTLFASKRVQRHNKQPRKARYVFFCMCVCLFILTCFLPHMLEYRVVFSLFASKTTSKGRRDSPCHEFLYSVLLPEFWDFIRQLATFFFVFILMWKRNEKKELLKSSCAPSFKCSKQRTKWKTQNKFPTPHKNMRKSFMWTLRPWYWVLESYLAKKKWWVKLVPTVARWRTKSVGYVWYALSFSFLSNTRRMAIVAITFYSLLLWFTDDNQRRMRDRSVWTSDTHALMCSISGQKAPGMCCISGQKAPAPDNRTSTQNVCAPLIDHADRVLWVISGSGRPFSGAAYWILWAIEVPLRSQMFDSQWLWVACALFSFPFFFKILFDMHFDGFVSFFYHQGYNKN